MLVHPLPQGTEDRPVTQFLFPHDGFFTQLHPETGLKHFVCLLFFSGTARNGSNSSGPANAYTGSTSNYYVHTGKVSGGKYTGVLFGGRRDFSGSVFH